MLRFKFLVFVLGAGFVLGCALESDSSVAPAPQNQAAPDPPTPSTPTEVVKYKAVLSFNWSRANYPTAYPSSAHFSRPVGWTHKKGAADFMRAGALANSGMKEMAETGGTATLSQKLTKEIAKTNGLALYVGASGPGAVSTVEFEVQVSNNFHYVSFVSMLAPSPDWYVGAVEVNLKDEAGNFVSSNQVNAPVYDSGTDSGDTFAAANQATPQPWVISRFTSPGSSFPSDATKQAAANEAAREAGLLGFTAQKITNTHPILTITFTKQTATPSEKIIWTGAKKVFTKADNTDFSSAANQDRITDRVWLTRSKSGGGFINAKAGETSYSKATSPAGVRWAEGSLANLAALNFKAGFHNLMQPKNAVNKNLVLWLVEENIYLSLKITAWSQGGKAGNKGGFSYERSTK